MATPRDTDATVSGIDQSTARRLDIRHLSQEQLAQLGVSQVAYVKPVMMNGTRAYAIHAADGEPMAVAGDQDLGCRRHPGTRDGRRAGPLRATRGGRTAAADRRTSQACPPAGSIQPICPSLRR